MNIFLIFILLLIFIYEFSKRIKYLENNEFGVNINEKFENKYNNEMTYLPANFP